MRCPCSIGNEIQPAAAAQTEALLSGHGTLVPTHGARVTCFPMNGSLLFPAVLVTKSSLRLVEIRPLAGRNPHSVRSKSAGAARRRKSPQNFRSAGFVYPGSYLLSRDLSSDYHRRADVSLPGSEWDRVGPSGYDHQALALLSYLPGYHFCGGFSLFSSRLTSAWLVFCVSCSSLTPITLDSSRNCLSPGWCIRSVGC